MNTFGRCFILVIGVLLGMVQGVRAQSIGGENTVSKLALVIGNATYSQPGYSLKNPINDAELMAQTLRKLGFDVRKEINLGRGDILRVVSDFAGKVPSGATTFVYFAGHGMQVGGQSYLVPVDMEMTTEQKVPLRAMPLDSVMDSLASSPSAVNIVVLDACRNNPFAPRSAVRYRGMDGWGLAKVKAPRGTVVAFSTAPNQLAPDGASTNSVYTSILAESLLEPGVSLVGTLQRVGEKVRRKTFDDQIPWFSSSLADDYYFLPPQGTTVVAGKSLQTVKGGRVQMATRGLSASPIAPWYLQLNEREWSELDWEINQRVKHLTPDELPLLEHQAKGGSVVAQTTLGIVWREGIQKASTTSSGSVIRFQANNGKALQWLQMASRAGFPVAQVELAEMYFMGHGVVRDKERARSLFAQAAQSKYPRALLGDVEVRLDAGDFKPEDLMRAMGAALKAVPTIGPQSRP